MQQAVDDFRSRGFENVTFKNTWDSAGYKGMDSTWRDPVSGQVFEVQFHTPESFTAKMDGHVLYEKERLPGISHDDLAAIRAEQSDLFGKVPVPHGAGDLHIDLGHEPHGSALPEAPPSTTASTEPPPCTAMGRRPSSLRPSARCTIRISRRSRRSTPTISTS